MSVNAALTEEQYPAEEDAVLDRLADIEEWITRTTRTTHEAIRSAEAFARIKRRVSERRQMPAQVASEDCGGGASSDEEIESLSHSLRMRNHLREMQPDSP